MQIIMRQCTVKPAWIGHDLKRRPYWEEQTRLIPSVFYMLSFHAFLKQKTVKRTLVQTDNIFSPQIKKRPAWRGHKSFRNSREAIILEKIPEKIILDIFVNFLKKKQFFTLQNSLSFILSCSLQPTNNSFCATKSGIDLQTILHPSMNYWCQYCDLH